MVETTHHDVRSRAARICNRWQPRLLELADLSIHIEVAEFARDDLSAFAVRDSTRADDFILYLHPRSSLLDEPSLERLVLHELVHILHRRIAGNDNLAALDYLTHMVTVLLMSRTPDEIPITLR
jgi:hypothetical protein